MKLRHVITILLFSSLVVVSFLLQATDGNFVDKLNSKFKASPHFEVVRSHSPLFTVVHYAGKVEQVVPKILDFFSMQHSC